MWAVKCHVKRCIVVQGLLLILALYILLFSYLSNAWSHLTTCSSADIRSGVKSKTNKTLTKNQTGRNVENIRYLNGQVWVRYQAPLDQRLQLLNDVLSVVRVRLAKRDKTVDNNSNQTVSYVYHDKDTYLRRLAQNERSVVTIYLELLLKPNSALNNKWNSRIVENRRNFHIVDYFQWYVEPNVCKWYTDEKYSYLHDHPCISATLNGIGSRIWQLLPSPRSIDVHYVTNQIWGGLYEPYLTYVHVIKHGKVSSTGDVFGENIKLISPSCSHSLESALQPDVDIPEATLQVDEVFVISQVFGESYSHFMTENLPRLAPYLEFLRKNPQVLIHVIQPNEFIQAFLFMLGFDSDRIVIGPVEADMIYLPKSTVCGNFSIFEGQLLARKFQSIIKASDVQVPDEVIQSDNVHAPEEVIQSDNVQVPAVDINEWATILLVQKSGNNVFGQLQDIDDAIYNLASDYGYGFEVYPGDSTLTLEQTMQLFYSARIIVSPYGAALSNMIFTRPRTYIIEASCSPPYTDYRYLMSAYHLGLIYYGLAATGCEDNELSLLNDDPDLLGDVLKQILDTLPRP